MFAISLTLVAVVSTAFLLYQFWSGALAPGESDASPTELRPESRTDRAAPPAQAA